MMKTTYRTASVDSVGHRETNDCGVKALAIVCEVPYARAHAALKAVGRRDRKGTTHRQLMAAAQSLGFLVGDPEKPPKAKTMTSLPTALREAGLLGNRYIVWVPGHIAAFAGGKVEDWTSGRRHRIEAIYRVERVPTWTPRI